MYGSAEVIENLGDFTCKHTLSLLNVVVGEPASFPPAFTFGPSIVRHLIRKVFYVNSVVKFEYNVIETLIK